MCPGAYNNATSHSMFSGAPKNIIHCKFLCKLSRGKGITLVHPRVRWRGFPPCEFRQCIVSRKRLKLVLIFQFLKGVTIWSKGTLSGTRGLVGGRSEKRRNTSNRAAERRGWSCGELAEASLCPSSGAAKFLPQQLRRFDSVDLPGEAFPLPKQSS